MLQLKTNDNTSMQMKNLILCILITFGISSCTDGKKSKTQIRAEEWQRKEIQKEKAIDHLNNRYNFQYSWDTISAEYSIELSPIINSTSQIITEFEILDIAQRDSIYTINVLCHNYPSSFFFYLSTTNRNLIDPLIRMNYNERHEAEMLLVVSINYIEKGFIDLYAVPEGFEDAYVESGASDDFFGKGKLINLIVVE